MRVIERISGTAGRYVLTGTVSLDERGQYVARATTCIHTVSPPRRAPESAQSVANASGPDLEATGASAPEARTRLCVAAREQLAATVTSFAWRPVLVLVAAQSRRAPQGSRETIRRR